MSGTESKPPGRAGESLLEATEKAFREASSDACRYVSETDREALDEDAWQDLQELAAQEHKDLANSRWRGEGWFPAGLPENLRQDVPDWQGALSERVVAGYCAAVSVLFRRAIQDADGGDRSATGRIESIKDGPYFEVAVHEQSEYAMEVGLRPGKRVSFPAGQIAHQIARHCEVPPAHAEIAWCAIADSLVEAPHILPDLEVTPVEGSSCACCHRIRTHRRKMA